MRCQVWVASTIVAHTFVGNFKLYTNAGALYVEAVDDPVHGNDTVGIYAPGYWQVATLKPSEA